MHGFVHNACGFGDAAFGIDVCEGGKRDPDYLLSCPHCPLQAVMQLSAKDSEDVHSQICIENIRQASCLSSRFQLMEAIFDLFLVPATNMTLDDVPLDPVHLSIFTLVR